MKTLNKNTIKVLVLFLIVIIVSFLSYKYFKINNNKVVNVYDEAVFKSFINTNYPNYKIDNIVYDPTCNGDDAYDVAISYDTTGWTADNKKEKVYTKSIDQMLNADKFSVILSPKGELIQTELDISADLLPFSIKEVMEKSIGRATSNGDTVYHHYNYGNTVESIMVADRSNGNTTQQYLLGVTEHDQNMTNSTSTMELMFVPETNNEKANRKLIVSLQDKINYKYKWCVVK